MIPGGPKPAASIAFSAAAGARRRRASRRGRAGRVELGVAPCRRSWSDRAHGVIFRASGSEISFISFGAGESPSRAALQRLAERVRFRRLERLPVRIGRGGVGPAGGARGRSGEFLGHESATSGQKGARKRRQRLSLGSTDRRRALGVAPRRLSGTPIRVRLPGNSVFARMSGPLFRGVFTALVTPFRDGAARRGRLRRPGRTQVAGGVHGVVPVGTTGETATQSHDEHRRVVELCVETAAGRVPVIAGAGSNSTAEAIELSRHAKEVGADAVLVVTPYYNRPSQEGLYRHYAAIAEAVDLPVVVYNVPFAHQRGHRQRDARAAGQALPNIVGIKDATGDLRARQPAAADCADETGSCSPATIPARSATSPTAATAASRSPRTSRPAACAALLQCGARAATGRPRSAWQDRLVRLHKALFLDASPAPTKFALAHLGPLRARRCRLPIAPCARGGEAGDPGGHARSRRPEPTEQADRREPPRAVRLLPGGHARGRPHADRHRGEVVARWAAPTSPNPTPRSKAASSR